MTLKFLLTSAPPTNWSSKLTTKGVIENMGAKVGLEEVDMVEIDDFGCGDFVVLILYGLEEIGGSVIELCGCGVSSVDFVKESKFS